MSLVRAIHKRYLVAGADLEGDVGNSEGSASEVDVAINRESPIQKGIIAIRNDDIDWVGVARIVGPVDVIGDILDPVSIGGWALDVDSKSRSGESKESERTREHVYRCVEKNVWYKE